MESRPLSIARSARRHAEVRCQDMYVDWPLCSPRTKMPPCGIGGWTSQAVDGPMMAIWTDAKAFAPGTSESGEMAGLKRMKVSRCEMSGIDVGVPLLLPADASLSNRRASAGRAKLHHSMKFLAFAVTGFVLLSSALADETLVATPILALPRVISKPGVYKLSKDFAFTKANGIAIAIAADNVILDLNGHTIRGTADLAVTTAIGIGGTDRRQVTIRNGSISGFADGINLNSSNAADARLTVEKMFLSSNASSGITLKGGLSIVRHNHVSSTGNPVNTPQTGIYVQGANARVLGNDVINTGPLQPNGPAEANALVLDGGGASVVENNRVSNQVNSTFNLSRGIYLLNGSQAVSAVNNTIINFDAGLVFDVNSSGIYRDNIVIVSPTPYSGGTNGGNNN
jgi:hypothetical protein